MFCCFLVSCATQDNNLYKSTLHTKIGTGHLQNGNIPSAFRELQTAIMLDPNNAIAHNNLALAYKARKLPESALKSLDNALKIDPNFTDAKINKAAILIEEKKYAEAIPLLKESTEDLTYQTPELAYTQTALALYELGKYKESQKYAEKALYFNPNHCPAKKYFGLSLYSQAEYKKAAKSLEQSQLECTAKKYPEFLYFLGMSYYKLGEISKAKARLTELVADFDTEFEAPANELIDLM